MANNIDTTFALSPDQLGLVLKLSQRCWEAGLSAVDPRDRYRKVDLAYQREQDTSAEQARAKLQNALGNPAAIQNFTVPVVMPQVEGAVTYQTSVFLSSTPIFGVVSAAAYMDEAMQLESLVDEHAHRTGLAGEIQQCFRDGYKYNIAAIEIDWATQKTPDFSKATVAGQAEARLDKDTMLQWQGNKGKRIDPYNLVYDRTVDPNKCCSEGMFAGYIEMLSRVRMKQLIADLGSTTNVREALSSGLATNRYYEPVINSEAGVISEGQVAGEINWARELGFDESEDDSKRIQYKDTYEVFTLYARILPVDFRMNVPARNTPQIWKFVIVNNQHVILAKRMTNAHNYLPIVICMPTPDGLKHQSKSVAESVSPVQSITSAFWYSILEARRRSVGDKGVYDPSRIDPKHMNSANPVAKIPVRPSAYGKPVSDAYYPLPYRDDQTAIFMQEAGQLKAMANEITGQNPVRQGQFVKGNKTRHEFADVMANANGRDQCSSLVWEYFFFTPLKHIILHNILQYQGATSVLSRAQNELVEIDPAKLRSAVLQFKISDGLTPNDKLMNTDAWQVALQILGSSPNIASSYELGPLFSYLIKLQGAQIKEFEKSAETLAYEEQVRTWQATVQQLAAQKVAPENYPPQPQPPQAKQPLA